LKARCSSIKESKSRLETDINEKTAWNRTLISDMNSLRPEIKRLHKQREQAKKLLLDQGESLEAIDSILLEERCVYLLATRLGHLPSINPARLFNYLSIISKGVDNVVCLFTIGLVVDYVGGVICS